jgi:hypothetical protein
MTLKDIGVYKNRLITTIIKSDDICELILGENYDKTDIDEKIIYNNVFPYLYVNGVQDEVKTYICIEVSVPKTYDFTYKNMEIDIWCYCHKDIMQYHKKGYLGTRADILSDMVDRLLNSSNDYGIGRLKLQSCEPLNVSMYHYGRHLTYSCAEFNIENKI